MTNHTSTQERLEPAPVGTLRATCVNLAPLLLAALLVGCSTKATHLGSLSGDPTLAGNDTAKRRANSTPGAPPNTATSGSSDSASAASQSGAGGSQEGAGSGQAGDLASNEAGASSSGDSAAGVAGGARAGGNHASASGSKAGAGGAAAAGAASAAGTTSQGGGGASAVQTAATDSAAGGAGAASGGGTPGTGARGGASSTSGGGASSTSGGGAAASDGDAQGAAAGADLSQGDATAAIEGGAAGAAGQKRGGAAGASGVSGGAGGDTAATMEGDGRVAAIDVPSGKVKVDEEYRPQTLGGALPLVLGVNEEGRFDFDQYALRPEVQHILDDLAAKLKTAEYDRLDIVGYTDRIGTTDYNRRLSELRAYAVAQYLMGKGVPQNKIHYEGRGEKNPLTPSVDCQGLAREELITCLQKDRRVEIEASIHRKHATVVQ